MTKALCTAALLLGIVCDATLAFAPTRLPLSTGRSSPRSTISLVQRIRCVSEGESMSRTVINTERRNAIKLVGVSTAAFLLGQATGAKQVSAAGQKTALVVGASGSIGQSLCQQLLDDGYIVKGLTRDPEKMVAMAPKIEWFGKVQWLKGDLKQPETLQGVMKGVDKVVFAAGARAYDPSEGGLPNNKRIFSDSVGTLADLAKKDGQVSRFVLVSSGGVTHFTDYPSPTLQDCLKWKLNGEKLLRESGIPYTIVRFYFYGNKDSSRDYIQVTQGDPRDKVGGINLGNLAVVLSKSMEDPTLKGTTFEVYESMKLEDPKWEDKFKGLKADGVAVALN